MTELQPQSRLELKTPETRLRSFVLAAAVGVAFCTGAAIAALGSTLGWLALATATAVSVPVAVRAAGDMVGSYRVGCAIVALAATFAVIVRHDPDITLLELLLIGPVVYVLVRHARELVVLGRDEWVCTLFLVACAGLLLLGALYSFWSPTHLGLGAPRKELGKNAEIFAIALAVLAYTKDEIRFGRAYAVLAMISLVNAVSPVFGRGGRVLTTDSLMTDAPLLFIVLAIPFLRKPAVAYLVGVAGAEVALARTRGAWIGILVVLVLVLRQRRFRRLIGRGGVAAIGIGTVAIVVAVLAVPSLRVRLDPLVNGHDQSVNTRLSMLHAAELETQTHPLTGVGPGHFKAWLVEKGDPIGFRIGVTAIPKDPHDTFAKFSAEMGLPGLTLHLYWVAAVLSSVWLAWRRYRLLESDSRASKPFVAGLVLYAPIFLLLLLVAEWGSLTRVNIALASGLFLGLARLVPRPTRPGPATTA